MDSDFSLEEEEPLFDWAWVADNLFGQILPALLEHLMLSFVSVGIALAISLPVGVAVTRRRSLQTPVTVLAGFLFTIPNLAFFAILISVPGIGVGALPAIIALSAYSLLILIRNVVAGLDSVPAATREAARGMGLTGRQILFGVEIPLALPVIVAGVRIASVTVIGIAAIAAFIGGGGLGDLIFEGIDRDFPTLTIVGAALAALIAITTDVSLNRLEKRLRPWAKRAARAA